MIYCQKCGETKNYPFSTENQTLGLCDICNKVAQCNDVPDPRIEYIEQPKTDSDKLRTNLGASGKPLVPGAGPLDAELAIIGEAPGEEEELYAKPFIGRAGQLLTRVCNLEGIPRPTVYIDNVVPIRPPGNKLKRLEEMGLSVEMFYDGIKKKIRDINPKVVVLLGNAPLKCFLGLDNITKRRGSVYKWEGITMVPSLHPSGILRGNHQGSYLLQYDLRKAKHLLNIPEPHRKRNYIVDPTFEESLNYLEKLESSQFLTCDIETKRNLFIDCIGFTDHEDWAVCIPFHAKGKARWTREQEIILRHAIIKVMQSKSLKIMHNMMYELFWFYFYGIPVNALYMDTMLAMHTIYPEFKKALWNAQSLYTNEPYHKDEGREADNDTDRWIYNCKDVVVTHEISKPMLEDLIKAKLDHFFFNHVMREVKPYRDMSVKGIKIDAYKWRGLEWQAWEERVHYQELVDTAVGHPLNVKSFKQMKKYFYIKLNLTQVMKKGKPTLDEDALWHLSAKYPSIEELQNVIKVRNRRTFIELSLNKTWDADGRLRFSMNPAGAKTGRSSASECPFGTGLNPQQTPRPGEPDRVWKHFREVFVVDDFMDEDTETDWVFLAGDLSQAEARMVTALCDDRVEKQIYQEGKSVHVRNAAICTDMPMEQCKKGTPAYELGKASKHAYNYGIGPIQLYREIIKNYGRAERPLPENFGVPLCKRILARFDERAPLIRRVFHAYVQEEIKRTRTLYNPFGRRRVFTEIYGDALFRSGYSTIPQSTVVDIIHRAMHNIYDKIMHRIDINELPVGTRLILQVHDSLVAQCKRVDIDKVKDIMKRWMEVVITINGDEMVIPVEFKVGKNLKEV